MTTEEEAKIMGAAFDAMSEWYIEIHKSYDEILDQIGGMAHADFIELVYGVNLTDKAEIVSEPEGDNNNESFGVFTDVFVDQQSFGDSGDSYTGCIYAKFGEAKWLKVSYDC